MENIQASTQNNQEIDENFVSTDLSVNIYAEKSELPMYDFKVKIIHTDLMSSGGFHDYFHSLNNSGTVFMSQYSGYIAKLSQLNNFEGGTLAVDESNNIKSKYVKHKKNTARCRVENFNKTVYHADIAESDVVMAVERAKREREEEKEIALINGNESIDGIDMSMKEFLNALAEMVTELNQKEAWELEEVDIPGSLYMFDMLHPPARSSEKYSDDEIDEIIENEDEVFFDEYYDDCDCGSCDDESDEFRKFDEELTAERDTLEIDFDTVGSIRFLENNILEVEYDESSVTGEADAFVKFLLNCEDKDFVTIHRSGQSDILDMWLDCEKGKRVNSTAHSRNFSAVYSVKAKEIVNNLTPRGGYFKLSYIRETNGMPLEIVTHVISASPV